VLAAGALMLEPAAVHPFGRALPGGPIGVPIGVPVVDVPAGVRPRRLLPAA
jgi:hypothetical protein